MLMIAFVVMKVVSSDEINAHKLSTNIIGTTKVQKRFKVGHAFTHRYLKSTSSALERSCEAVTSHPSELNYLVLFQDARARLVHFGNLLRLARSKGDSNADVPGQDFLGSVGLFLENFQLEAAQRKALSRLQGQLVRTPVGRPPLPGKSCVDSALERKVRLDPHHLEEAKTSFDSSQPGSVDSLPQETIRFRRIMHTLTVVINDTEVVSKKNTVTFGGVKSVQERSGLTTRHSLLSWY